MLIGDYLLANAEIEKYFRSIFSSNENFKIFFRDLQRDFIFDSYHLVKNTM